MYISGNVDLNLLNHDKNRKILNFLNLIYQNGMIPTIKKPTRASRKTATAIDHILTNSFMIQSSKQEISKLTYLTISQFVVYHRILYHKKIKTKVPLYIKWPISPSLLNALRVHCHVWDNCSQLKALKKWWKMFFISPYFTFSKYLHFCLDVLIII